MSSEMTRKEFMQTLTGVTAAGAYLGFQGAYAASKPKLKLGVELYGYGGDFFAGSMSTEDCIADVADMGAEGISIIGESHVPNYPNPPDKWVEQWFGWMDKYKTKPGAMVNFVDTLIYKGRYTTPEEGAEHFIRDCKLANKLGIKALRASWPPYPADDPMEADLAPYAWSQAAIQTIEKALPAAEKYDVRIAVELHSPSDLNGTLVNRSLEYIEKTKTQYFGFCPDMSIFTKRLPRIQMNGLIKRGARENIMKFIDEAYQNKLGAAKTVAEVQRMGGNEIELEFAGLGGAYHFSWNDPKDLAKILPYSYHFHAKFWEMTDDFKEYSIPYEDVIPVILKTRYDWWYSSEYEGPRGLYEASKANRKHHYMLRKLMEKA